MRRSEGQNTKVLIVQGRQVNCFCRYYFNWDYSRILFKVAKLLSISFGNFFSAIGIIIFRGYFNVPALIKDTLVWLSDKDSVSIITLAVVRIGFTKRISVSILF